MPGEEVDILDSCACSGANLPRFVQPVLLALLAQEPVHGYALVRKLADTGLFGPQMPDMTGCYRMLRDMEKNGVLESVSGRGEGPSRRIYAVTERGMRCLNRWTETLARSRGHLESVLDFLQAVQRTGRPSWEACPLKERAFMEEVRARALAGELPRREDMLRLLSYAPRSAEAAFLGRLARSVAREVAGDTARVWAAVGVDCAPCPMNCAFCAFGRAWGVVKEAHEWATGDILGAACRYAFEGAAWVVLRTTEQYGLERLSALTAKARELLPERCVLVANTGQKGARDIEALKKAGVEVMYHALRLGEGRDTPFDPGERRAALNTIRNAGMTLACLAEPLGVEHTDGEIADSLLAALSAGAEICGVMARINVPGTPFEGREEVSEERLAQVAAVARLCGGTATPHICVHPPVPLAVEWGANVLVVETGAVPRDAGEAPGEWKGFSVEDARKMFVQAGYAFSRSARDMAGRGREHPAGA